MSRSAFSYTVSALLHLLVYGVATWTLSTLPDRLTRRGETVTLLTMSPATAEPMPAEVERPVEKPATAELQPQQLEPPRSEEPRRNPQLERDPPHDPATPSSHDVPPPVLLAQRNERNLEQRAESPPHQVTLPVRKLPQEAVMEIMQPADSGTHVDQAPRKLPTNPKPEYPADARAAGLSGRVVLLVSIRADGTVGAVRVVQSSGVASIDRSALVTVRDRWRFEPARRLGVPVPFDATLGFNFGFDQP